MLGKHIQLPLGIVRDKSKEKSIKLNLPPSFRKDVLFYQLPYLGHLENPAIVDIVKNGIVDDLSLQKYLLATGLLKDNIQVSFDMIVSSDGKLSDAVVRRQLHRKFPSGMRKTNPFDMDFKNKAKFDTQNLIIGTLSTQIEAGKLSQEKQVKKQLESAPSIKDLKVAERLKGLRDFNQKKIDDDDNDNNGNDSRPPGTPPPPPYDFLL